VNSEIGGALGLALGTVQWGTAYGIANRVGKPKRSEVSCILDRARLAGVTTLDTARAYGDSEQIIGDLTSEGEGWSVITKLHPEAMTACAAADSLRASRQALGRSSLNAVLLHRANQRSADAGKLWDYLRRERDGGRVQRIGVSAVEPDDAWNALQDIDVDCIQVATSLLDQRLVRAGFFDEARILRKHVFVRSVFLQGVAYLPVEQLPSHLLPLRDALSAIAIWSMNHGSRPRDTFLEFAAGIPGIYVLLGCETLAQLEDNLESWTHARARHSRVSDFAHQIPTFSSHVLNPALWPSTHK